MGEVEEEKRNKSRPLCLGVKESRCPGTEKKKEEIATPLNAEADGFPVPTRPYAVFHLALQREYSPFSPGVMTLVIISRRCLEKSQEDEKKKKRNSKTGMKRKTKSSHIPLVQLAISVKHVVAGHRPCAQTRLPLLPPPTPVFRRRAARPVAR